MDLGAELREAAVWLLAVVLGGLALAVGVGRVVGAARAGPDRSEARLRAWERRERHAELLPGTHALHEVPRVRLWQLEADFSEPALLAFAQRALEAVVLAVRRGLEPPLSLTPGALESLRAGPPQAELVRVTAGAARLVAVDRSPEWRTLDLSLVGLLVARDGEALEPWTLEAVWRLRLSGARPLPSPAELEALAPREKLWEILSILDQRVVRADRSPPALPPWGSLAAPPEPEPELEQRRAALLSDLAPEEADLEAVAARLVHAALVEPDPELVGQPLRAALACARDRDALCGYTTFIEDAQVLSTRVLSLRRRGEVLGWEAWVVVEARRWMADARGAVVAGEAGRAERGALEIRVSRDGAGGWTIWDLHAARG